MQEAKINPEPPPAGPTGIASRSEVADIDPSMNFRASPPVAEETNTFGVSRNSEPANPNDAALPAINLDMNNLSGAPTTPDGSRSTRTSDGSRGSGRSGVRDGNHSSAGGSSDPASGASSFFARRSLLLQAGHVLIRPEAKQRLTPRDRMLLSSVLFVIASIPVLFFTILFSGTTHDSPDRDY